MLPRRRARIALALSVIGGTLFGAVPTVSAADAYDFGPGFGPCLAATDHATTTIRLLADCQTSHTILVPDGWTLDGDEYTITAVDPAGGHFVGAVVRNGGDVAHVTDIGVTTSGLATVCDGGDDRLRGILLDGASGSVTFATVTNIAQGPDGCQEGNAIEARNAPFVAGGADTTVVISDNVVSGYQKTGIVINGSVAGQVLRNSISGLGPVDFIAQNGIQIGFGGTAIVRDNTIVGNDYTPESYVSCGLLLFEADGVKASRNSYSANEYNICNLGKGGGRYNPEP